MKSSVLFALVLLLSSPAIAQDYHPLETGNFWSYRLDDGSQELRVVGEQVPIFGTMVYPISHPISSANQSLVNYWSTGPDGDLLLWGWMRPTGGVVYQPPITEVDSPLFAGKTWTNTAIQLYLMPENIPYMVMDFDYEVFENATLTVPAGEFDSYRVGVPAPPKAALFDGRYNLKGEAIGVKTEAQGRWYSANVGVVQEYLDALYQLETYTGQPVAVESASWDQIKALFSQ